MKERAQILWAWIRAHCWALCHLSCLGSTYLQESGGRPELQAIAACTSDWRIRRVFYERTPGAAERTFTGMREWRPSGCKE